MAIERVINKISSFESMLIYPQAKSLEELNAWAMAHCEPSHPRSERCVEQRGYRVDQRTQAYHLRFQDQR